MSEIEKYPEEMPGEYTSLEKMGSISPKNALELFNSAVNGYEKANPDFYINMTQRLILDGFRSLRKYMENPEEKDISWDSPFCELRYPVEWDFENNALAPYLRLEGSLIPAIEASSKLATGLLKTVQSYTLRRLTHEAYRLKSGDDYELRIPVETIKKIEILSKKKRVKAYKTISEGMKWKFDSPAMEIGTLDSGKPLKIRFSCFWNIQPFIVDPENKTAYYPIYVGLALSGKHAKRLSPQHKSQLWDALLETFGQVIPEDNFDFELEALGTPEPLQKAEAGPLTGEAKTSEDRTTETEIQKAVEVLSKEKELSWDGPKPEGMEGVVVRPIEKKKSQIKYGQHFVKSMFGKPSDAPLFDHVTSEGIAKIARENGIRYFGIEPSWSGFKAYQAVHVLLKSKATEIPQYIYEEQEETEYTPEGQEVKKMVTRRIQNPVHDKASSLSRDFLYGGKLPVIEITPIEYYRAYGLEAEDESKLNWERTKEALESLNEISSRQFIFSYERFKRDEKGKKVLGKDREPIKQLVEAYRSIILRDLIYKKLPDGSKRLEKIRIIPAPILVDEIESHFLLYPQSLLEDIQTASGKKKGKGRPPHYQTMFIYWLHLRAEEDRNRFGAGEPLTYTYEQLARTLKMDAYIDTRNHKRIKEEILPKCFEVAQKLGYLAEVTVSGKDYTLRINPEKFSHKKELEGPGEA